MLRTLGNGCVTCYDYDRRGVTKVENLKSDLIVISTFEYTPDRTGDPLSILREDGSCVYYEYDLNQQLTRETQTDDTGAVVYAWEWDYDRAGNRTWQQFNGVDTYYTYNAGNELTVEITDGVPTYYEFDRNGNQTVKDGPDGTTLFHYDFENLLRQIDLPDGAHNYFTYDADSKRVSAADSGGYTRFVYQGPDMLKLLQERDADGDLKAQYTMGQGLEAMRRGEASSFYHYDWLGSAHELTDEAEAVTDAYRYNAWGVVLTSQGPTPNPYTYAGARRYYRIYSTQLYLLGLRYYLPTSGRMVSRDPSVVTVNEYQYAANNAASMVDPTGEQWIPVFEEPGVLEDWHTISQARRDRWYWEGPLGGCWISFLHHGHLWRSHHVLENRLVQERRLQQLWQYGGTECRTWTSWTEPRRVLALQELPSEDFCLAEPPVVGRLPQLPPTEGCKAWEENHTTANSQSCCEDLYNECLAKHEAVQWIDCIARVRSCELGSINSPNINPEMYYVE